MNYWQTCVSWQQGMKHECEMVVVFFDFRRWLLPLISGKIEP
jgi:hypothetical protein